MGHAAESTLIVTGSNNTDISFFFFLDIAPRWTTHCVYYFGGDHGDLPETVMAAQSSLPSPHLHSLLSTVWSVFTYSTFSIKFTMDLCATTEGDGHSTLYSVTSRGTISQSLSSQILTGSSRNDVSGNFWPPSSCPWTGATSSLFWIKPRFVPGVGRSAVQSYLARHSIVPNRV